MQVHAKTWRAIVGRLMAHGSSVKAEHQPELSLHDDVL
jgi:hypothetical protein